MSTSRAWSQKLPQRRPSQQKGAVLVVALVFLIILTTLAVTNMREVALESRITGNLVDQKGCFNSAEAGLRDGEYRIAGRLEENTPGRYRVIPVSRIADIGRVGPPDAVAECSSDLDYDEACVINADPQFTQAFIAGEAGFAGAKPYSPDGTSTLDQDVVWYAIPYDAGASQGESVVPEYGAAAAGIGEFHHEINSRASDATCETRLRSTVRRVYL